ncbi:Ger(x)C family spore germination protein [Paenibacillus sp. CF384]|uniref:Ger(x)C family spore germination protein n=1 Tax=Paenibacillus sp. CF384 TaxID=1884382 RepID=UPI00089CC531|nr:Ger(x)C family spore germination protein [Paenibacillus sp. CF384]SDW22939.1 spore germination protein KC [Paenibacillus sp. CF384]
MKLAPIRCLLLPCLFAFLLTGCWDREEVNNMALIISAGIDKEKNGMVSLTFQVFIPNPSSTGGAAEGGQGRLYTATNTGKTVPDALAELQAQLPRRFSWSHAKAYFFGEALARDGLQDEMDFLVRDIQPREQANLFICKGTAKELIQSLQDPNTYETLIKMSQKPSLQHSTLHIVEELISGESGSFVIPVATTMMLASNGTKKAIISVEGMAVIKDLKLVGFVDAPHVQGFKWLTNTQLSRFATMSVRENGGIVAIRMRHYRMKWKPRIQDGKWKMTIRIRVDGDVLMNSTHYNLMKDDDRLRKLGKRFEEEMTKQLRSALWQAQHRFRTDAIGFAKAFHIRYPGQWRKVMNSWDQRFTQVEVDFDVDVFIRQPGKTSIQATRKNEDAQ